MTTKSDCITRKSSVLIQAYDLPRSLEDAKTDKEYKAVEDRLISMYLDIKKLRDMRREVGYK